VANISVLGSHVEKGNLPSRRESIVDSSVINRLAYLLYTSHLPFSTISQPLVNKISFLFFSACIYTNET